MNNNKNNNIIINNNNNNNNNDDPSYNAAFDKKILKTKRSQLISSQIRAASAAFSDILSSCSTGGVGGNKRKIALTAFENEKRAYHILSERQRRYDLKKLFENLRDNIPALDEKHKASKLTILKTAAEHLNQIGRTNERLKQTFQKETLKQKQLMQYLRTLETETFLDLYSNNNTTEQNDNSHIINSSSFSDFI